jgi:hypothetical protein
LIDNQTRHLPGFLLPLSIFPPPKIIFKRNRRTGQQKLLKENLNDSQNLAP